MNSAKPLGGLIICDAHVYPVTMITILSICYLSTIDMPLSLPAGAKEFKAGAYKYSADLLDLEAATAPSSTPPTSSPVFHALATWEPYLSSLPNQRFATFLRRGFQNGFRIGADLSHPLHSSAANMPSALANPEVVDKYIAEEVGAGKLQAVTNPAEVARTHCSPLGITSQANSG